MSAEKAVALITLVRTTVDQRIDRKRSEMLPLGDETDENTVDNQRSKAFRMIKHWRSMLDLWTATASLRLVKHYHETIFVSSATTALPLDSPLIKENTLKAILKMKECSPYISSLLNLSISR